MPNNNITTTMNSVLILGIFFLLAIIAPVIYLDRLGKARVLKAKKALLSYAKEKNTELDELEYWNDKALGVNRTKKLLLFVNVHSSNSQTHSLDLSLLKKCTISHEKESIDLVFESKQINGITTVRIQMYNKLYDNSTEAGYNNQIAKKWARLIEEIINKNPTPALKSA
jgi:hypothetical protein